MGRTKVSVKYIENEKARTTCFTKRRKGLFKKAMELSILCGVDVTLIVRSSTGHFQSYSNVPLDDAVDNLAEADAAVRADTWDNDDFGHLFEGKAAKEGADEEGGKKKRAPRPKRRAATASRAATAAAAAPDQTVPKKRGRKKKVSDIDEDEEDDDSEYEKKKPAAVQAPQDARIQDVPNGPPLMNQFATLPTSVASPGFTDLAQMLPTPSWNAQLEAIVGQGAPQQQPAAPSNGALQGAVVAGAAPAPRKGRKRSKRGPGLSVDTAFAVPVAKEQGGGGGEGAPPSAAEGPIVSPGAVAQFSPTAMFNTSPMAGQQWLVTPGMTPGTTAFGSFGLGAFPTTPEAVCNVKEKSAEDVKKESEETKKESVTN